VNQHRPEDYWNYKTFEIAWSCSLEDYEVGDKLGSGKYSDVFEAFHRVRDERCVIKILKPVREELFQREIKILQNLQGGPNIVKLLDVIRDPQTQTPALVFERMECIEFRKIFKTFVESDIRHYMFEILKALDYAHSNGIMHRDVKPANILIDHDNRRLKLIDWGLGEFYHVEKEYNVRVATRYYKGPELLVNMQDYDYSLDIWSLGCAFATMLFLKTPFFNGKDNEDQLFQIVKVLGTAQLDTWLEEYGIALEPSLRSMIGYHSQKSWSSFVNSKNEHLCSPKAFDLLDRLLRYEPQKRLTAREAMEHPYFAVSRTGQRK